MAKAQHTPAPWLLNEAFTVKDGKNRFISISNAEQFDGGEYQANARLIATAPELLEEGESLACQVRDAIGAINEFLAMPCESLKNKLPTTVARLKNKVEKLDVAIAKARGE